MALLPIRLYPEEILRQKCRAVEAFDEDLATLVANLVETMLGAPGVGLAAPQVGVDLQVAVVDVTVGEEEDALVVLINPEIVDERGEETDVEGCLSIPDFTEKVQRPTWILVRADDVEGNTYELEAEGFVARAICHEVDHLNGILFVDRLHGLKRDRARRYLRKLERQTAGVWA